MAKLLRGQIYRRKVKPGEESIENKRRPLLIVSPDELNRGSYVLVVPFTSQQVDKRKEYSTCVLFYKHEFGLLSDSIAKADEVSRIPIFELNIAEGPLGRVDVDRMKEVALSICHAIGFSLKEAETGLAGKESYTL